MFFLELDSDHIGETLLVQWASLRSGNPQILFCVNTLPFLLKEFFLNFI